MEEFLPNLRYKEEMLKELGYSSIEELFSDIPSTIKVEELNLPSSTPQYEVEKELRRLANKNSSCDTMISFLGGGVKPHYIPAVVKTITSRSEFYTAYTPYQAEASQGFLQAMFEYQSLIAELTGMDVANCSMYDGATSLGEAALMSARITKRKVFLIPRNISWEKKSIVRNYTWGVGVEIREVEYDKETGMIDIEDLRDKIDENVSGLYVENPNFFGVFEEEVDELSSIARENNCLFIVGVDPLSLGIVRSPGDYGADIAIGEGRALGNPMDFGGSSLGIFACRKKYVRQLPGRLIGLTRDSDGRRAFCMTLQTREQHIRRGKATSNICTNEGFNALAATIYLAWLGSKGLYDIGRRNFENTQKLVSLLIKTNKFERIFKGTVFNEFVLKYKGDVEKLNRYLLSNGIHGGLPIERWFPELKNSLLFGITELYGEYEFNRLLSTLEDMEDV